jgi:Protein of unknown function (DUF2798)
MDTKTNMDAKTNMEGKARYIFPAIMSGVMAFLMTAFVTWKNLGFPPDFIAHWLGAFVPAWPLAYLSSLLAMPIAKAGTARIMALLNRFSP